MDVWVWAGEGLSAGGGDVSGTGQPKISRQHAKSVVDLAEEQSRELEVGGGARRGSWCGGEQHGSPPADQHPHLGHFTRVGPKRGRLIRSEPLDASNHSGPKLLEATGLEGSTSRGDVPPISASKKQHVARRPVGRVPCSSMHSPITTHMEQANGSRKSSSGGKPTCRCQ